LVGRGRGARRADDAVVHERIPAPDQHAHEARVASASEIPDAGLVPRRTCAAGAQEAIVAAVVSDQTTPMAPSLARTIVARLDAYERLIRLDKPIGTLLLLWPTLTALWLASSGEPSWIVIGIFTLGTLLMRSAGCAMNDYADRNFDPHVERTAHRPLAQREIEPWEALAVAAILALCSFLLIVRLNRMTLIMSIPALAIALVYPFVK